MTHPLAAISSSSLQLPMLGGAAALLYVLGRLVMGAIPRGLDGSSIRAMLASITVLVVSVTAVVMGRTEAGLHLPIAAATGALTFGIAATILGRGAASHGDASVAAVRSWMLVVPAVALVLIGGFGGRVDGWCLLALGAFGLTALSAWLPDRSVAHAFTVSTTAQQHVQPIAAGTFGETIVSETTTHVSAEPPARVAPAVASHTFAVLVWVGCVALAAIAGVLAMLGLPALESMRHVPPDALVTVFLLAPAIVVPMVFELLPPCRPIGWTASVSTLAKFAVLCLCVALPLVVLVTADLGVVRDWLGMASAPTANALATTLPTTSPATTTPATPTTTTPTTTPVLSNAISSTQPATPVGPSLAFPSLPHIALSTDLLVLAAASLMLLPMAGGWLRPGKLEAAALFACYVLNLLLVIRAMIS